MQQFIDAGGEIFILNKKDEIIHFEKFCIIDYLTIITSNLNQKNELLPNQGSAYLKENQETLIESYIDNYLDLKNRFCKNRY